MSEHGKGVLLFDIIEPKIHGYLILGEDHYQIVGEKVSDIRTNLHIRKVMENATQQDMFEQGRDKWHDLGPVKQAGIRCKEPTFWAWLREGEFRYDIENENDAAQAVRTICGVISRADLGKPGRHKSRALWHQIDTAYQAWLAKENA